MVVGKPHQLGDSGLAFDECRDRRALPSANDQVSLPVTGLPAGLHRSGAIVDGLHGRALLEGAVLGPAAAALVPIGPTGAQRRSTDRDDELAVDGVVDGFRTHVPCQASRVAAAQPAADLFRRPAFGELAGDDGGQRRLLGEDPSLRSSTSQMSLIMGKPRLVGAIGFAVACDLPVECFESSYRSGRQWISPARPQRGRRRSRCDRLGRCSGN